MMLYVGGLLMQPCPETWSGTLLATGSPNTKTIFSFGKIKSFWRVPFLWKATARWTSSAVGSSSFTPPSPQGTRTPWSGRERGGRTQGGRRRLSCVSTYGPLTYPVGLSVGVAADTCCWVLFLLLVQCRLCSLFRIFLWCEVVRVVVENYCGGIMSLCGCYCLS